jgi:hypothetical protein
MIANPETLKYKIGQRIVWQEADGSVHQGVVVNIGYYSLDVLQGSEEIQVSYDSVLHNH